MIFRLSKMPLKDWAVAMTAGFAEHLDSMEYFLLMETRWSPPLEVAHWSVRTRRQKRRSCFMPLRHANLILITSMKRSVTTIACRISVPVSVAVRWLYLTRISTTTSMYRNYMRSCWLMYPVSTSTSSRKIPVSMETSGFVPQHSTRRFISMDRRMHIRR